MPVRPYRFFVCFEDNAPAPRAQRRGLGGTRFSLWGLVLARPKPHRLNRLRKNSQRVIPKGWVCPRNLLFLGFGEEKQIPRFARDDKKSLFPQPVKHVLLNSKISSERKCERRNALSARSGETGR